LPSSAKTAFVTYLHKGHPPASRINLYMTCLLLEWTGQGATQLCYTGHALIMGPMSSPTTPHKSYQQNCRLLTPKHCTSFISNAHQQQHTAHQNVSAQLNSHTHLSLRVVPCCCLSRTFRCARKLLPCTTYAILANTHTSNPFYHTVMFRRSLPPPLTTRLQK
jgi:hypothetical protein